MYFTRVHVGLDEWRCLALDARVTQGICLPRERSILDKHCSVTMHLLLCCAIAVAHNIITCSGLFEIYCAIYFHMKLKMMLRLWILSKWTKCLLPHVTVTSLLALWTFSPVFATKSFCCYAWQVLNLYWYRHNNGFEIYLSYLSA